MNRSVSRRASRHRDAAERRGNGALCSSNRSMSAKAQQHRSDLLDVQDRDEMRGNRRTGPEGQPWLDTIWHRMKEKKESLRRTAGGNGKHIRCNSFFTTSADTPSEGWTVIVPIKEGGEIAGRIVSANLERREFHRQANPLPTSTGNR